MGGHLSDFCPVCPIFVQFVRLLAHLGSFWQARQVRSASSDWPWDAMSRNSIFLAIHQTWSAVRAPCAAWSLPLSFCRGAAFCLRRIHSPRIECGSAGACSLLAGAVGEAAQDRATRRAGALPNRIKEQVTGQRPIRRFYPRLCCSR